MHFKEESMRDTMDSRIKILPHVSWGAIIAGAILAISLQFMLGLLGTGIGLVSANPEDGMNISAFGWGAAIWLALTFIISLFAGGFVASRLSANMANYAGALNSLVVWALVVGLNLFMAGAGISNVASSLTGMVGSAAEKINVNAPQAVTGVDFQDIEKEIDQLLQETDNEELKSTVQSEFESIKSAAKSAATEVLAKPGQAQEAIDTFTAQAKQSLQKINQEVEREDLAEMVSARTDMSEQEAQVAVERWEKRINDWSQNFEQKIDQAQDKALKQAQEVTDTSGTVALYAFFILLLGMIAAAFGGRAGTRRTKTELVE